MRHRGRQWCAFSPCTELFQCETSQAPFELQKLVTPEPLSRAAWHPSLAWRCSNVTPLLLTTIQESSILRHPSFEVASSTSTEESILLRLNHPKRGCARSNSTNHPVQTRPSS